MDPIIYTTVQPPKFQPSTTNYFSCPIDNCNKKFKEKGNLITHLRVHVSH